jgi:hypothetical protein
MDLVRGRADLPGVKARYNVSSLLIRHFMNKFIHNIICKGDSSSSGAQSGTSSGNNGGSDNYGSESYP